MASFFHSIKNNPCCQISDMVNWGYNIQYLSLASIGW